MDRLLPRDEPNTDAFADRAVLVLKGSVALTCASAPYRAAALPVCQPCLAASLSVPCFLISPHILPRDADPLLETPCPEKPPLCCSGPGERLRAPCGSPQAALRRCCRSCGAWHASKEEEEARQLSNRCVVEAGMKTKADISHILLFFFFLIQSTIKTSFRFSHIKTK